MVGKLFIKLVEENRYIDVKDYLGVRVVDLGLLPEFRGKQIKLVARKMEG